ncbi:outer membrane lipoprotein chaperone LolA [Ideonella sp. A 288]|uniref:outer membrane lipoprotein chaperone LolA n=1 Tax=Ideonella sp. A 288 TaxID=1962181 RepID=UPI000B4B2BFD|nr:outer membrane lipoprotein chaperone LolA [Ideonella sp. A 288]
MKLLCLAAALALTGVAAHADSVDTLREFSRDVRTARADFTQTVTSPDGAKKKVSSGTFEFARPNRFRFAYRKPFEQLIVSDGKKVWLHDPDLNQVSIRAFDQALGATPAALLSGGGLERDFELSVLPARDGLDWVKAVPRTKGGGVETLQIGFKGRQLAALEIVDAFGQRSLMQFAELATNFAAVDATYRFVPPAGADVVEQPR